MRASKPIERQVKAFRGGNDDRVSAEDFVSLFRDILDLGLYPRIRGSDLSGLEDLVPSKEPKLKYSQNKDFWRDALAGRHQEGISVALRGFHVTEWMPQSPGRYFTDDAINARRIAKKFWSDANEEYLPLGKLGMVLGGVGCVRLKSRNQRYFLGASSNGIVHQGIPLVLFEPQFTSIISEIGAAGGCVANIHGFLTVIPEELSSIRYPNAVRKYRLFAHTLTLKKKSRRGELLATVAVMYPSIGDKIKELEKDGYSTTVGKRWTFCSFDPSGGQLAVRTAADWILDYAIRHDGGKDLIFSEFDEHCSYFNNPLEFPLKDVVDGRPDAARVIVYANQYHFNVKELIVMDPATAAAFLSGLASVSTIAKNIHDWILAGKVPEKKVILEDADKAASAVAEDSKAIESVLRISEKVFKSIERRIKRARKKLEEVLGDPYMDDEDRREIMKECDKTICEALKDVKHYNNGALPKKLKDFWEEHSCDGKS